MLNVSLQITEKIFLKRDIESLHLIPYFWLYFQNYEYQFRQKWSKTEHPNPDTVNSVTYNYKMVPQFLS